MESEMLHVNLHSRLAARSVHRSDVKKAVRLAIPGGNGSIRSEEAAPMSDRMRLQARGVREIQNIIVILQGV